MIGSDGLPLPGSEGCKTDFLTCSFPEYVGRDLFSELAREYAQFGGQLAKSDERFSQVRFPMYGKAAFTFGHRAGAMFSTLSWSGAALEALRDNGEFERTLWAIHETEAYKVTSVDIANDRFEHSPPILEDLYRRAVAGRVKLSRKAIPPDQVRRIYSPALYDAEESGFPAGLETGTVELGKRSNEVRHKGYDKRQERISQGWPDPGPWHRDETTVRAGLLTITLRDVAAPTELYWHIAGKSLYKRPEGVRGWVEGEAAGYTVEKRPELTEVQKLKRMLENSEAMRQLIEQADRVGPYGRRVIQQFVDKAYRPVDGDATGYTETPAPTTQPPSHLAH